VDALKASKDPQAIEIINKYFPKQEDKNKREKTQLVEEQYTFL
jgi:hypothetical protein